MVNFCFKRNNKLKKSFVSEIHGACSNTNLNSCSLYYEQWQIRNPDIFIICGLFRTFKSVKYSKVPQYLHPCQIFCNVLIVLGYNQFLLNPPSQTILDFQQDSECPYVSMNATYLQSNFRFCFRHIQSYLSIIQVHIHTYSKPFLSLAYSERIFKSSTVFRSLSEINMAL